MNAPIIFCHYGYSEYLQYTLKAAKLHNPDKLVFLLGNAGNYNIAKRIGIKYFHFSDFRNGEEINTFENVYKLVRGKKYFGNIKNNREWVKFVFKRWFYIYNFLQARSIEKFWHFDSDNMIVERLSHHEYKFNGIDCTEQCNGCCMNGYIARQDVVKKYISKINGIFQDEDQLKKIKQEFKLNKNSGVAFTEMRAYLIFKEEEKIKSMRLNTILNGSTFDDCICQEHGMAMELAPWKPGCWGRKIKKIYLGSDGCFFCCEKKSHRLIQINSLNLSWVPDYLFKIVLSHSMQKKSYNEQTATNAEDNADGMHTLSSMISSTDRIIDFSKRLCRKTANSFNKRYQEMMQKKHIHSFLLCFYSAKTILLFATDFLF